MAEFKSYKSFRTFARFVIATRRYVRDAEQDEFLQTVLATSDSRQELIEPSTILYRAQRHKPDDAIFDAHGQPLPYDADRMKPLRWRATEGRANPKGIPYLYAADEMDTAVNEVRPSASSYLSLAELSPQRQIRVVNCVSDRKHIIYGGEPSAEERELAVWRDIDSAFSEPVNATDDVADYVPTQILAEFFREKGFDGVKYGSSLANGHSIALFDPGVATFRDCRLVKVRWIEVGYMFVEYYPSEDDEEEESGT
jgi:hypothetical protein